MYGGTPPGRSRPRLRHGLSPRVRGNHLTGASFSDSTRSIPACTGEPPCWASSPIRCWVYPRVYGGTARVRPCSLLAEGLSPRVRGNRRQNLPADVVDGSIPACTGEPGVTGVPHRHSMVYPRVYGGTAETSTAHLQFAGLSPRVRGNPVGCGLRGQPVGSIPACTGEPKLQQLTIPHT